MLNIYLLTPAPDEQSSYDRWVAAARNENHALEISPDPNQAWTTIRSDGKTRPKTWGRAVVTRLGVADCDVKAGLVCAVPR